MNKLETAYQLLKEFKGDAYHQGSGALSHVGKMAAAVGKRAALVRETFPGSDQHVATISDSLGAAGVQLVGVVNGAKPNCPREDLFRITKELKELNPDVIVSFGGGSTIDSVKGAEVLRSLGGDIEVYFGVGEVTSRLAESGKMLTPHIAIQSASSSAAHLTKYSNITDAETAQKKLIVDDAIVPGNAIFDYDLTRSQPRALTLDGALDGLSHALEVYYSAVGMPAAAYEKARDVALTAIDLVVRYLPKVARNPSDAEGREALGLATDLGGYAIMIGGTNGAHLTSFSLVDILSHGRACAMLNPYYTVFFAPAVEEPLRLIGEIYRSAGYSDADFSALTGREAGVEVAESMFRMAGEIGFPTRLDEIDGFGRAHIDRALEAAKNPQLRMKLQNMPVPLTADLVDEYMGPILEAAVDGDLSRIKNLSTG